MTVEEIAALSVGQKLIIPQAAPEQQQPVTTTTPETGEPAATSTPPPAGRRAPARPPPAKKGRTRSRRATSP